jgi:geranylgeranyl diphosphate synthase type I
MIRNRRRRKGADLQVEQLWEETYGFIEKQILPGLEWPAFQDLLKHVKERRKEPWFISTDVFPALACQAAGGDPRQAVPLSAAWLLNILAGRIFDDQQDGEGEQQAWLTARAIDSTSVGLFALGAANAALSYLHVERDSLSDIICAFGNIVSLSARAQIDKLDLKGLTLERYLANIAAKTGIVFATGAWTGARTAKNGASELALQALHDYGMNLGMAIQIADDCADLQEGDLSRQHFTLPVVYALNQIDHPRHPQLISLLEKGAGQEMGALEWAVNVASLYRAKALAALEPLPRENVKELTAYATGEYEHLA